MHGVMKFHEKFKLGNETDLDEFESEIDWIAKILEIYLSKRFNFQCNMEREGIIWKKTFQILKLLIFEKMELNNLVHFEDHILFMGRNFMLRPEDVYQMILLSSQWIKQRQAYSTLQKLISYKFQNVRETNFLLNQKDYSGIMLNVPLLSKIMMTQGIEKEDILGQFDKIYAMDHKGVKESSISRMIEEGFSGSYNYEDAGVRIKLTGKNSKQSRIEKYKYIQLFVIIENFLQDFQTE